MAAPEAESQHAEVICSVCLELVSDTRERSTAKLICGHTFHLDCIGSAFNAKGSMQCPNCRGIEHGDWLYGKGCPHPELSIFDQPADDLESFTDWEAESRLEFLLENEDDFLFSSVIDRRSNQERAARDFSLWIEDWFCREDFWITRDVPIRREDLIKREDVLIRTEDVVVWLGGPSPYAHAQAPVPDWCVRNERVRERAASWPHRRLKFDYWLDFMPFLGGLPNLRPSNRIIFSECFGKLVNKDGKEMRVSKKFGHDPFKLEGRNLAIRRYPFGQHPFNSQGQSGRPHHLHSGKTAHLYGLHSACLVHTCRKLQAQSTMSKHGCRDEYQDFVTLHDIIQLPLLQPSLAFGKVLPTFSEYALEFRLEHLNK